MVEHLETTWEITVIGSLTQPPKLFSLAGQLAKRLGRGRYLHLHTPQAIAWYGWQIQRRLARIPPGVIFATNTSVPLTALTGSTPAFFWSDTTWTALVGYYDFLADVSPASLHQVLRQERRAFARCTALFFASDWAAEAAQRHFPETAKKISVVPFGANFDPRIHRGEAARLVELRPRDKCRLLFLGVEWERKGGPLALEAAAILNARGINAVLTVVGCRPRVASPPPYLRVEGFLRRDQPEEAERLDRLLREAHFLVLPSRAEAFGVAFCEAAAYAVPSISTRTGGIPTAVLDGRTGALFEIGASAASYADVIGAIFSDPAGYRAMALSAHAHYASRLNWRTACGRVTELIHDSLLRRCTA
jgi:glycosyltransferase involved in cell wall biosynthesis